MSISGRLSDRLAKDLDNPNSKLVKLFAWSSPRLFELKIKAHSFFDNLDARAVNNHSTTAIDDFPAETKLIGLFDVSGNPTRDRLIVEFGAASALHSIENHNLLDKFGEGLPDRRNSRKRRTFLFAALLIVRRLQTILGLPAEIMKEDVLFLSDRLRTDHKFAANELVSEREVAGMTMLFKTVKETVKKLVDGKLHDLNHSQTYATVAYMIKYSCGPEVGYMNDELIRKRFVRAAKRSGLKGDLIESLTNKYIYGRMLQTDESDFERVMDSFAGILAKTQADIGNVSHINKLADQMFEELTDPVMSPKRPGK